MADTPGSSGPNIGIGVDTEEGRKQLEGLRNDFTKFLGTLDEVLRGLTKGDEAMNKSAATQEKLKKTTKDLTEEERKLADQQRASIALQKDKDAIAARQIEDGNRLIAQLRDQIAVFGMTSLQVKQYRAELMGVGDIAAPLIAQLQAMTDATKKYGVVITEVAQIERARLQWEKENANALREQKIAALEEQAQLEKSAIASLKQQRYEAVQAQLQLEKEARSALREQKMAAIAEQTQMEKEARSALREQRMQALADQVQLEKEARSALREQKMQALGDQAQIEKESRSALREQKMTSIAEQEQLEKESRSALREQRMAAIAEQVQLEKESRSAIREQRMAAIAEQVQLEKEARSALREQKMQAVAEQTQMEKEAVSALREQRMAALAEQIQLEKEARSALREQRMQSIADQVQLEKEARSALREQKMAAIAEQEQLEKEARSALREQRMQALADQLQLEKEARSALREQKMQALADQAAMEKEAQASLHEQRMVALEAQKTMEREARAALNEQRYVAIEANKVAAVKAAETTAIEEIEWGNKSVKARIAQLELLQQYRMSSMITEDAIRAKFSSAAIADLANLDKLKAEYAQFVATMTNQKTAAAATAEDIAEKQALAEMAWSKKSLQAKIADLERLKEYQANAAIRPETIGKEFSPAAIKDLPNLEFYKKQVEEIEKAHKGAHSTGLSFSEALSHITLNSSRARSELIVLGHEISQGSWRRFASSLMVMAEYTNAASLAFTGMGVVLLGTIAVLGTMAYAAVHAIIQQREMQNAIILTGNYAGITEDRMNDMAHAITAGGQSIGKATEALIMLTASGKFSAEQIDKIADSAVRLERGTGYSIDKTVKNFESLQVKVGDTQQAVNDKLLKAMLALDEQFHYLDSSMVNQIIKLTQMGEIQKASALATDQFNEATRRMADEGAKNIGHIERGWIGVKDAIGNAIHALGEWGKTQTAGQKVQNLSKEIAQMDIGAPQRERTLTDSGRGGYLTQEQARAKMTEERAKKVEELSVALGELAKIEDDSIKRGEIQRKQSQVNYDKVAVERDRDMMERKLKGYSALKEKEDEYMAKVQRGRELAKLQGKEDEQFSDAAVKRHLELLRLTTQEKGGSGPKNDGRMTDMKALVNQIQAEYDLLEQSTNAKERLTRESMKYEKGLKTEMYDSMLADREREGVKLQEVYMREQEVIMGYQARGKVDAAQARKMLSDLTIEYDKAAAKIQQSKERIQEQKKNEVIDAGHDTLDAVYKDGQKELDQLDRKIEKQREYNDNIGKTAEQIQIAKEAREQARIVEAEAEAAAINQVLATLELDEVSKRVYTARANFLQAEIDKRRELAQLERTGADTAGVTVDASGMTKQAQIASQMWRKAGEEISKGLASAFGDAGKAVGKFFKAYSDGQADTIKIEAEFEKKRAAALNTTGMQQKLLNAENERDLALTQNKLNTYGNMAGAAAEYFDKGSAGYSAMMAASKVFHAAEMAMMVVRVALSAKEAILGQGKGDPYSAFARMAAMAAIVAAIGVGISASMAAPPSGLSSEDRQKRTGTQAQGNEAEGKKFQYYDWELQKSESLSKAIEVLGDNAKAGLEYSSKMLTSLKAIESGIGSLAQAVSQTAGIRGTYQDAMAAGVGSSRGFLGFNRSNTVLKDSGIKMDDSQTLETIRSQGVQAQSYLQTQTEKSSWFGMVKDYSNNTQFRQLDDTFKQQLGRVLLDMGDAVKTAAVQMGGNAAEIEKALNTVDISFGNLSLKDMKPEEAEKAISSAVSKIGDDLAKAAWAGLQPFQKSGENYLTTLVRVSTGMEKVKASLEQLGITAVNYTEIKNKQGNVEEEGVRDSITRVEAYQKQEAVIASFYSTNFHAAYQWVTSLNGVGEIMQKMTGSAQELIDAYKKLIDIRRIMAVTSTNPNNANAAGGTLTQATVTGAGGVDRLDQGANDFLAKYFTDAERAAIETARVSEEFKKLGQNLPANREEYRKLVTSIDMSSDAGQRLYGGLIALAGEFDSLMELTNDSSAKLKEQQDIVDNIAESLKRWYDVKKSADDLVNSIDVDMGEEPAIGDRMDKLWKLLDANSDMKGITAEQQLDLAKELQGLIKEKYKTEKDNAEKLLTVAKNLRSYLDDLKVGDLAPGTNTEKLNEAKTQYDDTLAKAKAGDADAAGALKDKAQNYLKLARDYYASSDPYKAIFADVYSNLDQYATTLASEQQLAAEGNKISAEQLAELQRLRDIVVKAQTFAEQEYNKAQETFVTQANILTTMQNQYNVMSTLPDLLKGLPAELAAVIKPSLIPSSVVEDPSKKLETAAPVTPINPAATAAAGVPAPYTGMPSFFSVNFGSHEQGLTKVPYDGYMAELHKDERVLTAGEAQVYNDLMARLKRAGGQAEAITNPPSFFSVNFGHTGKEDSASVNTVRSFMDLNFGNNEGGSTVNKDSQLGQTKQQPEKVLTSSTTKPYTSGNASNGNAEMAAEIKALREEVAGLRRDAAQQHQESVTTNYDANNRAADKVAKATCDAASKSEWSRRSAATTR